MTEPRLTLTRVFDAPRDLVFAAWTDPTQLATWWGPAGFTATSAELDVRPGGTWRTCIRDLSDGSEHWATGVYREVSPPERLAMTFRWEVAGASDTLITVSFADLGDKTELTFTQGTFGSTRERDGFVDGWSSCFDGLAGTLGS